jgi:hypothetical protein
MKTFQPETKDVTAVCVPAEGLTLDELDSICPSLDMLPFPLDSQKWKGSRAVDDDTQTETDSRE